MITGPILQDEDFVHIRTGDEYTVLHGGGDEDATLLKVGNDRQPGDGWQPAIVYYSLDQADRMFVRDEATFRKSFKRATDSGSGFELDDTPLAQTSELAGNGQACEARQ